MYRVSVALAATAFAALLAFDVAVAQPTPPPKSDPQTTVSKRAEAKRLAGERRAAGRQRRADCNKQATEQKLRYFKRDRFVRDCVRKAT